MKLLVFTDIHGDLAALERLMVSEADYYIAAGDLTSWGRGLDRCGEILRKRGERVYVLPGNHESEAQITAFAKKYGLSAFHCKRFEAGGYHVAGLGYSNPTPFNTPGEYSEEQIAERLKPFSGLQPLILICHCPPAGTELDRIRKGFHAGSHSVRHFIEEEQPAWFFCGHIHEAEGVQVSIGKTWCMNPGRQGYLLEV